MVDLADFYCALPALSRSLSSTYPFSPNFVREIKLDPDLILPLAAKLRNATLFRECLVWLAGNVRIYTRLRHSPTRCHTRTESQTTNLAIKKILQRAIGSIDLKLARVQSHALQNTDLAARSLTRVIWEWTRRADVCPDLKATLNSLLVNKSVIADPLCKPGFMDMWLDFFLCAGVDDEDLPWDFTRVDY